MSVSNQNFIMPYLRNEIFEDLFTSTWSSEMTHNYDRTNNLIFSWGFLILGNPLAHYFCPDAFIFCSFTLFWSLFFNILIRLKKNFILNRFLLRDILKTFILSDHQAWKSIWQFLMIRLCVGFKVLIE